MCLFNGNLRFHRERSIESNSFILKLYDTYPQLIPFTDLTMSFRLNVEGKPTEADEELLDEFRASRIHFVDGQAPMVTLSFTSIKQATNINYTVQIGDDIYQTGILRVEENEREGAGKLLAYRLFGIQKNGIGEKPKATLQPIKVKKENEVI